MMNHYQLKALATQLSFYNNRHTPARGRSTTLSIFNYARIIEELGNLYVITLMRAKCVGKSKYFARCFSTEYVVASKFLVQAQLN